MLCPRSIGRLSEDRQGVHGYAGGPAQATTQPSPPAQSRSADALLAKVTAESGRLEQTSEKFQGSLGASRQAFLDLRAERVPDAEVLDLFGASSFVPTTAASYAQIEETARRLNLLPGS